MSICHRSIQPLRFSVLVPSCIHQTHCYYRYFLTASYDGALRIFDYSQTLLQSIPAHNAPATSLCVVSSSTDFPDSFLIASASHDLTARLTRIDLSQPKQPRAETLAALHLHTAPLSSVAASSSHILTSSWDGLIGLWDTKIPETDEVPLDEAAAAAGENRKKRRKVADDGEPAPRPKRKAPAQVLKSHTARVSRVVFGRGESASAAYSCGMDSTVRTWDVENGLCTSTIVRTLFFICACGAADARHRPRRTNRSWTSR